MPFEDDKRRVEFLRVAELALSQFEAAGQSPPVMGELRRVIAEIQGDPGDHFPVEVLRSIMISIPELKALLRKEFPAGLRPPPFDLDEMTAG